MDFSRPSSLSSLSQEDEKFLTSQPMSPQTRPVDFFPVTKELFDPLSDNWTYDNATDLLALNSTATDPLSFDVFNKLVDKESKGFFMDPFAIPVGINGCTLPVAEDSASEFDSDDQTWSFKHPSFDSTTSESEPSVAQVMKTVPPQYNAHPQSRASSSDSTNQSTPNHKSRSPSENPSNRLSTGNQDPQTRNAAKRAAHNIIEKRYRSNMNAKFISLEKSISPASILKHGPKGGASSLKKSEILTNALAYIENMQQENQAVRKELGLLKQNLLPGRQWQNSNPF
ncbi:hypothetical protein N7510_001117 [Penicillium lagena]|uniref:uncharacterized protein n=1 Tax=Penicillium lagena TaxID=94218 RepID=UPI00253F984E|nr:uncharacterized protein N7510_001117 [Penicillium lagena]KAJ5624808.1 hypothetical protein N7510_001117 [Penicillium lagena]